MAGIAAAPSRARDGTVNVKDADTYFCEVGSPRRLAASPPVVPYVLPLPIPPLAQPTRSDETTDYYELTMRDGNATVVPAKQTPIRGYEGRWPGPTIRAKVGRHV